MRVALDLGVADFTVSQVARSLGVTTPALYRLFPSRHDLTSACLVAIGRELTEPPENLTRREILGFLSDQLWQALLRHPGLDMVMETFPRSLGDVLDPTGRMLAGLVTQGMSHLQITFAAQYFADIATTSVSQLRRQLGRTVNEPEAAEITGNFHLLYRRHVDILLDSLDDLAPDFPEMTGPIAVPDENGRAHQ